MIYLHRLYAVLSDDGRHPDNVALLLAAALTNQPGRQRLERSGIKPPSGGRACEQPQR